MKKYLAVLIASLLIILAGCGPENGTAEQTTKAASLNAISADEIDTTVGKSDQDAAYDESSATKITLTGASASISGNGASQKRRGCHHPARGHLSGKRHAGEWAIGR